MGLFNSYIKLTDEALMKRLQNHNIKAFDELYARYYGKLYGFVLKMMRYNEQSSGDIIQDVFVKLFQHPEKFDVSKNFKSWIYTVTANECKKKLRIKELTNIEEIDITEQKETKINEEELAQFIEKLDVQLEHVSIKHKEAFILRHQAGFSLQEIAEIQDCALGTVKSRLHYTTKFLAEKLSGYKELLHQNELEMR